MIDLFGNSVEVREKSGKVRKASGLLPDFLKGNRKSGNAGLSFPDKSGKSGSLPIPLKEIRAGNLRELIVCLENEMMQATQEYEAAHAVEMPYARAFWAAHRWLEELHQSRSDGTPVSKTEMMDAYDRKMWAGHAWHPHREKAEELHTWLKAIRRELTAVNKELGA